jgi:hypothetical protein
VEPVIQKERARHTERRGGVRQAHRLFRRHPRWTVRLYSLDITLLHAIRIQFMDSYLSQILRTKASASSVQFTSVATAVVESSRARMRAERLPVGGAVEALWWQCQAATSDNHDVTVFLTWAPVGRSNWSACST